jgi:hypothetical protein
MARKTRQQKERDAMIDAMQELVLLPKFQQWIDTLKQTKDAAVQYLVHTETVKNERESMATIGEIRAYLSIIENYEGQREQLEARIAQAEAERQQQQS